MMKDHIKKYGRGCIMNKKEILTIILLICVIFSLQAVSAADGGSNSTDGKVLSVSNVSAYALPSSDTNSLAEVANADSFSDLQDAVNGVSELTLVKNYTYKSTDTGNAGILIDHDIVIDGNGNVIIDADHKSRIFNIADGKSVTLKGITFINGNATGNGGSIFSDGKLTLDNCKFINNTASEHGGAVFFGPDAGDSILNCYFDSNAAGINGGAVDFNRGSSQATITGTTFNNNIANRSAGAVYWYGANGIIKDSNFTNNAALGIVPYEDSYGNVTYGGNGGAIMWTGSDGSVYNCTFVDNNATYKGGAVYLQGSIEGLCNNTVFDTCTFISNIAGVNGGAIDWYRGARNGHVLNSVFENNVANRSGLRKMLTLMVILLPEVMVELSCG